MEKLDISTVNKAALLAELYNKSRPLGLGALHFTPQNMTLEEAGEILKKTTSFDYLKGRVMKVELGGDTAAPWLYDRDNGEGAFQKCLTAVIARQ